ncbi:MAG: hypothetical protein LBP93_04860 [Treponema sp.]|nr:hypothetical protein [Treponema sp.]
MSLQKLLKEADNMGILSISANGPPSEALLRDSIKAEKEFRRQYGDLVEQNKAAFNEKRSKAKKAD